MMHGSQVTKDDGYKEGDEDRRSCYKLIDGYTCTHTL